MTITMAIFVYFLVWWVAIFTTLPFGNEPHNEEEQGHQAGAPKNPHLKKKMIATSLLSLIIVGVIHGLMVYGILDFEAMFNTIGVPK